MSIARRALHLKRGTSPRPRNYHQCLCVEPAVYIAKIRRGENEKVVSIEVGNECGMKIGYEDLAFPWAPRDTKYIPKNRLTFEAKIQSSGIRH